MSDSAELFDLKTFREVRERQIANQHKIIRQCPYCQNQTWYINQDVTFSCSDCEYTLTWQEVFP